MAAEAKSANWFSVRLELRGASGDAWKTLHKEMWQRGFRRFVIDEAGKMYSLPTGSYVMRTRADIAVVKAAALEAAGTVDDDPLLWAVEFVDGDWRLLAITEDPDAPR